MKALRTILMALVILSACSITSAVEFEDDFESYVAGSDLHGQAGWHGWDNDPGAGAPTSDRYAYSGSNSVEIIGSADLVHTFNVSGGQWVFRTMMYIPSGTTGTTYFILLNTYSDGGTQDWSIQTNFNLGTGVLTAEFGGNATADIIYDRWVEVRVMIDLDTNTAEEYYDGVLLSSHVWDDGNSGTIQCVDLYGNGASSVYYDDIVLETLIEYQATATNPSPADEASDVARDVVLSWTPGSLAATHDVYFGTDSDTVASASRANPMGVLVSRAQATASYDPQGLLDFGQVYYWRVDEVRADGTIDPGPVWSFTAEPLLYPMQNIVATTNANSLEGQGPENTVNGSGLNANDQHSTETVHMWLAIASGADPMYIQYEFDRLYKIAEMHVWNHNFIFEMMLGLGVQNTTVQYSTDGVEWTDLGDVVLGRGTGTGTYTYNTTVPFDGVAAKFVRLTINSTFGGSGQFGLSEVRFLFSPTHARYPDPADGAVDVDVTTALSWRSGREATSHEVHLGTDPDTLPLSGTPATNRYTPASLDLGTAYYWQVNEVNNSSAVPVWTGDLWSFTTQEYLAVDDFESYTDDWEAGEAIWQSWIDGFDDPGNGSQVGYTTSPFAEQTIVHGGGQSMPFTYQNANTSAISEADLSLAPAQNWTTNGIKSLSLWFYGAADNTGRLYVKINGTKVPYDGDTGDIAAAVWQTWNIDLATVGVNLSNVTSLTIGVEGTGTGILYIDDIRLYGKAAELIMPTEPDSANLVSRYTFDGNLNDSAGSHHGTAMGNAQVASDATRGQVLSLDGTGDAVQVAYSAELNPEAFTVSVWAKPDPAGSNYRSPITSRDDSPQRGYILYLTPNDTWQFWTGTGSGWNSVGNTAAELGEWTHLAATLENEQKALYINGRLAAEGAAPLSLNEQRPLRIGGGATEGPGNYFFQGMIDEVRIYDVVLSAGEVAGLGGRSAPVHVPF